ncbi:MAG: hypothetical protein CUN54_08685 [Phototrophicales bacterium]|nr:MAG: hypothetical protein CUN54_08685 [Phototrophicales bacterium]
MHFNVNLKVVIMDTDFYALHSINSYLAWDRRTRVTHLASTLDSLWQHLDTTPLAELPDIVVLDAEHLGPPEQLRMVMGKLHQMVEGVRVICMLQSPQIDLIEASAQANARGIFLKHEVRMQIAWAIVYILDNDMVVTQQVADVASKSNLFESRLFHAVVLPKRREFPDLTDRVRQALELCVIDGLPAHLAADEMGISLHTIRGYIKEGYRILESHDSTNYPTDMSPQERAFMRFTAFEDQANSTAS